MLFPAEILVIVGSFDDLDDRSQWNLYYREGLVIKIRLHCLLGFMLDLLIVIAQTVFKKGSMSCVYLHVLGGSCKFLQLL